MQGSNISQADTLRRLGSFRQLQAEVMTKVQGLHVLPFALALSKHFRNLGVRPRTIYLTYV